MSKSNFDIKLKEHFKLYISLKDKICFESELFHNNIEHYFDFDEQSSNGECLRYYFLESDSKRIDEILIKNGIITFTESNIIGDFQENSKVMKSVAIVAFVLIGILILASVFINLLNS